MEVTVPIYKFNHQRDLSRDSQDFAMKALPNSYSGLKFLFEKHCYPKKDALSAVKLDPAVLEAQVTVGPQQEACQCQEGPKNAIAAAPCDSTTKEVPPKANKDGLLDGGFKAMLSMQRAALQSLSPQQFDLLLKYVDTLRKQRLTVQKQMECGFCKNNGHPLEWYSTHSLKDGRGRVRCPVLRAFCCPRCGATGDHAHTIRYCPGNYVHVGVLVNTDKTTTTTTTKSSAFFIKN